MAGLKGPRPFEKAERGTRGSAGMEPAEKSGCLIAKLHPSSGGRTPAGLKGQRPFERAQRVTMGWLRSDLNRRPCGYEPHALTN